MKSVKNHQSRRGHCWKSRMEKWTQSCDGIKNWTISRIRFWNLFSWIINILQFLCHNRWVKKKFYTLSFVHNEKNSNQNTCYSSKSSIFPLIRPCFLRSTDPVLEDRLTSNDYALVHAVRLKQIDPTTWYCDSDSFLMETCPCKIWRHIWLSWLRNFRKLRINDGL